MLYGSQPESKGKNAPEEIKEQLTSRYVADNANIFYASYADCLNKYFRKGMEYKDRLLKLLFFIKSLKEDSSAFETVANDIFDLQKKGIKRIPWGMTNKAYVNKK